MSEPIAFDLEAIRRGDANALVDTLQRVQDELNKSTSLLQQVRVSSSLTPLFARITRKGLGAQNILNDTDTFVQWATPASDVDLVQGVNIGGLFDPAATVIEACPASGQLKLIEPGLYLVMASIVWDTNVTGIRRMDLRMLGSVGDLIARSRILASVTADDGNRQTVAALVPWSASGNLWQGRVAIEVYQNSGGTRTIAGNASPLYDNWFMASRVALMR